MKKKFRYLSSVGSNAVAARVRKAGCNQRGDGLSHRRAHVSPQAHLDQIIHNYRNELVVIALYSENENDVPLKGSS